MKTLSHPSQPLHVGKTLCPDVGKVLSCQKAARRPSSRTNASVPGMRLLFAAKSSPYHKNFALFRFFNAGKDALLMIY